MGFGAGYSNSMSRQIWILHVDDEPADLEITRILLQREGKDNFEITSVLSAEKALEKLENEYFDVVIADYKLPGMDGWNRTFGHVEEKRKICGYAFHSIHR